MLAPRTVAAKSTPNVRKGFGVDLSRFALPLVLRKPLCWPGNGCLDTVFVGWMEVFFETH